MEINFKNVIEFAIFFIFLVSCSNKKVVKTYHKNGKLKLADEYLGERIKISKAYDTLGKISEIKYFSKKNLDSLIKYNVKGGVLFKKIFSNNKIFYTSYKNKMIESRGRITEDNLKIGWWEYFSKKGILKSKREYVILCNDYYLNQSIIFDKRGDTVYKKGNFNESIYYKFEVVKFKDSIKLKYKISPISFKSRLDFVLLKSNNFCKEEVDTIISLDNRNGILYFKANEYNKGLIFDYYIDTVNSNGVQKFHTISRKMFFDLDDE